MEEGEEERKRRRNRKRKGKLTEDKVEERRRWKELTRKLGYEREGGGGRKIYIHT